MVTVDDYFSFWELDCLEDTKARTVICKVKVLFVR